MLSSNFNRSGIGLPYQKMIIRLSFVRVYNLSSPTSVLWMAPKDANKGSGGHYWNPLGKPTDGTDDVSCLSIICAAQHVNGHFQQNLFCAKIGEPSSTTFILLN